MQQRSKVLMQKGVIPQQLDITHMPKAMDPMLPVGRMLKVGKPLQLDMVRIQKEAKLKRSEIIVMRRTTAPMLLGIAKQQLVNLMSQTITILMLS